MVFIRNVLISIIMIYTCINCMDMSITNKRSFESPDEPSDGLAAESEPAQEQRERKRALLRTPSVIEKMCMIKTQPAEKLLNRLSKPDFSNNPGTCTLMHGPDKYVIPMPIAELINSWKSALAYSGTFALSHTEYSSESVRWVLDALTSAGMIPSSVHYGSQFHAAVSDALGHQNCVILMILVSHLSIDILYEYLKILISEYVLHEKDYLRLGTFLKQCMERFPRKTMDELHALFFESKRHELIPFLCKSKYQQIMAAPSAAQSLYVYPSQGTENGFTLLIEQKNSLTLTKVCPWGAQWKRSKTVKCANIVLTTRDGDFIKTVHIPGIPGMLANMSLDVNSLNVTFISQQDRAEQLKSLQAQTDALPNAVLLECTVLGEVMAFSSNHIITHDAQSNVLRQWDIGSDGTLTQASRTHTLPITTAYCNCIMSQKGKYLLWNDAQSRMWLLDMHAQNADAVSLGFGTLLACSESGIAVIDRNNKLMLIDVNKVQTIPYLILVPEKGAQLSCVFFSKNDMQLCFIYLVGTIITMATLDLYANIDYHSLPSLVAHIDIHTSRASPYLKEFLRTKRKKSGESELG